MVGGCVDLREMLWVCGLRDGGLRSVGCLRGLGSLGCEGRLHSVYSSHQGVLNDGGLDRSLVLLRLMMVWVWNMVVGPRGQLWLGLGGAR